MRSKIIAAGAVVAAASLLSTGMAFAAANLGEGDVAVLGSSSTSPISLVRGGTGTIDVTVTADQGNINDNQQSCDGTKNQIATTDTFTLTSTLTRSGDPVEKDLLCRNYSREVTSVTFDDLNVVAGATAPLGTSTYLLTFGSAGTVFTLGELVQLDGSPAWVDPILHATVNPRPTPAFTATAGVQKAALSWTASPDAADITDYEISVTGAKTATLTAAKNATSLEDLGLAAGQEYCYQIRARYNDGTTSFYSAPAPAAETCVTPTGPTVTAYTVSFHQPIDQGMVNKGKYGRVIPVKVTLKDDGVALTDGSGGPLSIGQAVVSCTAAPSDNVEEYSPGSSNHGTEFRWDGDQWIYNLDTGKLPNAAPNKCYTVSVIHDGNAIGSFTVQLVK